MLRYLVFFWALLLCVFFPPTTHAKDECLDGRDRYVCYGAKVNKLLKEKGVAAALTFTKKTILPANGYTVSHIVLHSVGEFAYYKEKDLMKTLEHVKPYIQDIYNGNGFDGFLHGSITSYFEDKREESSYQELMSDLCETQKYVSEYNIPAFECYHIMGHAVMHSLGNKLDPALAICDGLEDTAAHNGCYMGVFMENAFLYGKTYHPGIPRPDAKGDSMVTLCNGFTEDKNYYCSHFVGQVYLTTHPEDIKGSFEECKKLRDNYPFCIQRLARMFLPSHYKGNYHKLKETCPHLKPEYQKKCDHLTDFYMKTTTKQEKKQQASPIATFFQSILAKFPWL